MHIPKLVFSQSSHNRMQNFLPVPLPSAGRPEPAADGGPGDTEVRLRFHHSIWRRRGGQAGVPEGLQPKHCPTQTVSCTASTTRGIRRFESKTVRRTRFKTFFRHKRSRSLSIDLDISILSSSFVRESS